MTRSKTFASTRRFPTFARAAQRGQAMVEYLVGTLFVVMVVAVAANPTLFGLTQNMLQAIKDYFAAFAYAISVAAT